MDDWALVRELCAMFEINPEGLIEEAFLREVPARDIIAGFTRTLTYLRVHCADAASSAPVTELDARPPGTLDVRIVFNDLIWVDIFRRQHAISSMPATHVTAVIVLLKRRAHELFEIVGDGPTVNDWLESTPLMIALRQRLRELGITAGELSPTREPSLQNVLLDLDRSADGSDTDLPFEEGSDSDRAAEVEARLPDEVASAADALDADGSVVDLQELRDHLEQPRPPSPRPELHRSEDEDS